MDPQVAATQAAFAFGSVRERHCQMRVCHGVAAPADWHAPLSAGLAIRPQIEFMQAFLLGLFAGIAWHWPIIDCQGGPEGCPNCANTGVANRAANTTEHPAISFDISISLSKQPKRY